MLISRCIEIDMGHTLPNHYSFCNQIHGHRAKIVAEFYGEIDNNEKSSSCGMVEDFSVLKTAMMETIHRQLDHGFAVWEKDTEFIKIPSFQVEGEFTGRGEEVFISTLAFIKARNKKVLICDEPPTAEYLAKWAFRAIDTYLKDSSTTKCVVVKVYWYETPNNCAIYGGDDE